MIHQKRISLAQLFIKFVFILSPTIFILLPSTYFDEGQSLCLSKLLLHQSCWGCGMTRACLHALHLEFEIAYKYNPLFIIVLPTLIYLYVKVILNIRTVLPVNPNEHQP